VRDAGSDRSASASSRSRTSSWARLFLAVYEHGTRRVRDGNTQFADHTRWHDLTAPELIEQAVRELAGVFGRHAAFLRLVMLVSGVHPEIKRRDALYSRELGDQFTTLLLRAREQIDQPDPESRAYKTQVALLALLALRDRLPLKPPSSASSLGGCRPTTGHGQVSR
jgi:hypothetical protein